MADQNMDNRELEVAYFITTRRLLLRRVLLGFITAFIVVTFGFTSWMLLRLYVFEYDSHRQLLLELPLDLVNYQGFREADAPKGFSIISTHVLPLTSSRYDLAVRIANPNPKWFAEFDYQFLSEGLKSEPRHGFLLPNEEKYLVDLAVESTRVVRQPVFDIKNLVWRKVLDYEAFKAAHLNFKIEDLTFVPAATTDISGRLPVSQTTFKLKNDSAYNFWKVGLYVVLYSGTRVAAINYIVLERVESGDIVPVEVNWFEQLGTINRNEVIPEVNILDPKVYMEFEGDGREEFRTVPRDGF